MKKAHKFYRDIGTLKLFKNYLKSRRMNYVLHDSTYTTKIILPNGTKYTFINSFLPTSTFQAYARIVKDLKTNDFLSFAQENIKRYDPVYYDHSHKEFLYKATDVPLYDINGAYPQTIFNFGGISENTFKYLQAIPKQARLAALGMLASNTDVTQIIDGQIISCDPIVNKYSAAFHFCVQYVGEVLREVQSLTHENFLFFWVDGIYFKKETGLIPGLLRDIDLVFFEHGYTFSVDLLQSFIYERNNDLINIEYWKANNDGSIFDFKKFSFSSSTGQRLKKYIFEEKFKRL